MESGRDSEIERAEGLYEALERQAETGAPGLELVSRAVETIVGAMTKADVEAARRRVRELRARHPHEGPEAISLRIIRRAVQGTAAIGAASSGAAWLPGIGTIASMTVGTATDITATFKLQSEMVLAIAEANGFELERLEAQQLVFLVTGVSTGGNLLAREAGRRLGARLARRYAATSLRHALPVVGVAASSGTNAVATYVIGHRALAYFRDGPEAVRDWRDSLSRLTGLDEARLRAWLVDGARRGGRSLKRGGRGAARAGSRLAEAVGGATRRVVEAAAAALERRGGSRRSGGPHAEDGPEPQEGVEDEEPGAR